MIKSKLVHHRLQVEVKRIWDFELSSTVVMHSPICRS